MGRTRSTTSSDHQARRWPQALTAFGLAATGVLLVGADAAGADGPPVATQLDLLGPDGSERFGENVLVLSNGNFVVTDPGFDIEGATDVGAVHLYDGTTNQLISTLTGSTTDDRVGDREPIEVGDSNVVIESTDWDFGTVVDAGAVTWIDGTSGLDGIVSPANSLHGSSSDDRVGVVTVLADGDYVVRSRDWDLGAVTNVGAVTFAEGDVGITGPVTTSNSLHGGSSGDGIGGSAVLALSNGNYVVGSPDWNNGAIANVGASTWGNGETGTSGPITASNSLIGSTMNDYVGRSTYEVGTSDYVVASTSWDGPGGVDVGAVTQVDGETGLVGVVTTANSLHGTTAGDRVGVSGVWTLANGNYVVGSQYWDLGVLVDVGAATFVDAEVGLTGAVSAANSLYGTTANDEVAVNGVVALTNGNYVVNANVWDNGGVVDAGAAVWGDGTTGISGPVSVSNSLYGTSAGDGVGRTAALTNGNYVVYTASWDDGAVTNVGAVTFGDGATGITGPVSTANSLHGTTSGDRVGFVTPLADGDYVVTASSWSNGTVEGAGAVIHVDGQTGITGPVTTDNSLHGTTVNDSVGSDGATELTDGNYVVHSSFWNDGATAAVGAVTWVDSSNPLTGPVTTDNSLHGVTANDQIGEVDGDSEIVVLPSGHYVLSSDLWDDGANVDVGAVTVGRSGGVTGPVTSDNSAIGTPPGLIGEASPLLTSGDAIVVATFQNRVIVILSDLLSRDPARLLDTRSGDGISTVDGLALGWGRSQADTTIQIQIAGRGGVPANATTATLNIASIAPSGRGFATLYPCTDEVPVASSLNFEAGSNVSNAALVTLSPTGTICLYSSAEAHYALDVVGYTPDGSKVGTLEPARLLDTRSGSGISTIDGESLGAGRVLAGDEVEVDVAGRAGVPDDAVAAILNVAAVAPSDRGFVTLYPCSDSRPVVSSLNYETGVNISNTTIVKLSDTGSICAYTSSQAHLAIDVVGFVPVGSNAGTLDPARLLDTRSGEGISTVDGAGLGDGRVTAAGVIEVQVAGRGGVPDGAKAALVNLAAIAPSGKGFATLYPCTDDAPTASSLNYEASSNIANATLVKLSSDGTLCVFTSAEAHFAVDVVGFVE
jgi:trimeric autotransporter adhesin